MSISLRKVISVIFSPLPKRGTTPNTQEERLIKEPDLAYPELTSSQDRELQKAVDKYCTAFTTLKSIKEAKEAMAQTYKKVGFKNHKTAFRDFMDRRDRKTTNPISNEETIAVMDALLVAIPPKRIKNSDLF